MTTDVPAPKRARTSSGAAQKGGALTKAEYLADATECIRFRWVYDDGTPVAGQKESEAWHNPSYAHQHFGEEQEIKGYSGLNVDITMNAQTMDALVDVQYQQKWKAGTTDVLKPIAENAPGGICTSATEFSERRAEALCVTEEDIPQCSVLSDTHVEGVGRARVVHSRLSAAPASVRAVHQRLQLLLLFFIDGASVIDQDDPGWELLLCLVEQPDRPGQLVVAAFCTVYRFWTLAGAPEAQAAAAQPEAASQKEWPPPESANRPRHRLRLAQLLTLPPFQRRGLGKRMVSCANQVARQEGALDLTYEDPTDEMQMIREAVDLQRLQACSWFWTAVDATVQGLPAGSSREEEEEEGESVEELDEAADGTDAAPLPRLPQQVTQRLRSELHVNLAQARRVWEAALYARLAALHRPLRPLKALALRRFLYELKPRRSQSSSAAHKRILSPDPQQENFIMFRQGPSARLLQPGEELGAVDAKDNDEAVRQAAADMVSERMEQLEKIVASSAAHIPESQA